MVLTAAAGIWNIAVNKNRAEQVSLKKNKEINTYLTWVGLKSLTWKEEV